MTGNARPKFRTFFLSRVLGLEAHEYVAVAWSFAYFFCVLSSYYILRPVRETMAVGSGANTIPYLFMATFVVMMAVTPVFGWIASRYPRRTFLPWVYLFFITNILVFWFVFSRFISDGQDHVWLGRVFFVWLSVFNLFVVSVFWSFMADIYTREQGRRLFGVITAGGSIGAFIGGIATSIIVVRVGFQNLFPIAAALLSISILCIAKLKIWVAEEHAEDAAATVSSSEALGGSSLSGMTHMFQSKYFGAIAVASLIASLLGNALYIFSAELVAIEIPGIDERTRFFSNINIAANALALIVQMFVVKRVVSRFGVGASLSILPILSVVGFIALAIDPMLGAVAILTLLRRGLGFGFSKPTNNMLWSVVTPEEKYKTKNFIDTAVFRFGDAAGTWVIKVMMPLGISGVSLLMAPFALVWALLAIWLGRDYRRQARALKHTGIA